MSEINNKSVLITGCSTGIGAACVVELVKRGFHVFAGVRREEDANRLLAESPKVTPVMLDITNTEEISTAATTIAQKTNGDGLFGLVNNAGYAFACPIEFVPLDKLRHQFEVNFFSQIGVTQALLPLLRANGGGRIINISSISANVSGPYISPYAASKHAFSAFNDSLRLELRNLDVQVSQIIPADIKTPIWKKSRQLADRLRDELSDNGTRTLPPSVIDCYQADGAAMRQATSKFAEQAISASRVAKAVAQCLCARRPKTRYLVGSRAWAVVKLLRLMPDKLRDRIVLKNLGMT